MVTDPILKKIALYVFLGHLFFFFFVLYFDHSPKSLPMQKMKVYTKNQEVVAFEKKETPKKESFSKPAKESAVKTKPTQKKESLLSAKPKEAKKKNETKPDLSSKRKVAQEESSTRKKKELLDEIMSQLDSLQESPSLELEKKELQIPVFVSSLPQASTAFSEKEGSYQENAALFLQNHLELPEQGEVSVSIVIDRSGKVEKVEILTAKSRRNADFLKKRLQELLFPCFNEYGLTQNKIEFKVTFRNVENFHSLRHHP